MSDSPISKSTHRALLLPGILSEIFYWIDRDENFWQPVYSDEPVDIEEIGSDDEEDWRDILYSYGKQGVLARCCLVNKLWYDKAIPLLWRHPRSLGSMMSCTLPRLFSEVEPSRRQQLANYVKEGLLKGECDDEVDALEVDMVLKDIEFPNLKELHMPLPGRGGSGHIPRIGNNAVKVLNVDPAFDSYPDCYWVEQEELGKILEQIPVRFPHLRILRFEDRCLAYPGALEKCASRLPGLKRFEHSCVVVGTDYPHTST